MRVREEPFDLASEVASAAGVPTRTCGNATLIACEDAPAFVDGCESSGVRVIGAEGFDLVEGGRRPDMSVIIDLGELTEVSDAAEEARAFVSDVCRAGLLFEFQLERA